jgi:hypothetical protein
MTGLVAVVWPSEDGSPMVYAGVGFAPPSFDTPSPISACLRRARVISQQLNSMQARHRSLAPKGIPTEVMFLGEQTGTSVAERHGNADLGGQ